MVGERGSFVATVGVVHTCKVPLFLNRGQSWSACTGHVRSRVVSWYVEQIPAFFARPHQAIRVSIVAKRQVVERGKSLLDFRSATLLYQKRRAKLRERVLAAAKHVQLCSLDINLNHVRTQVKRVERANFHLTPLDFQVCRGRK